MAIVPVATMFSIAMAANAAELSIIYADKGGFYDNFINAGRHHRRMQASR
jgi:hypothetical protein